MLKTNGDTTPSLISDEALMLQYTQGSFAAFEQLYQRHKGGLYRYFLRQLGEPALAEDLFQEIWSKVISHASQYQVEAKFSTWLYTLARHRLIDHARHLKVVDKVIDSNMQDNPEHEDNNVMAHTESPFNPENQWQQQKRVVALKGCIQLLPIIQRECFLLKEEAGLNLQAIAEVMDASFEACKSRLRYAYDSLRQCVERKMGGAAL